MPAATRTEYYEELERLQMGPLWVVLRDTLTKEPRRRETPFLWPWSAVRRQMLIAGEIVSTAEAERRVLMFLNPGNPGQLGATATLYAAMQLILPGESARAHRHTPAALRFVVEGRGAFTCVDGDRVEMAPGDLVLTPPLVWHDHGNTGNEAVMWLDGLDIPLLLSLNGMFFEEYHQEIQEAKSRNSSPVWRYPWVETREHLEVVRKSSEPDPFDGFVMPYVNPATGGDVLPTIGCRLQLLPAGSHTRAHRHATSAVYHVAEGRGFSIIDGMEFPWQKGDTFAVPIWCWHEHTAPDGDAVLFSYSDEPVLAALGYLREQPYPKNNGRQVVQSTFGGPAR